MRERVLQTFRFAATDSPPVDLMEGCVWPELLDYFRRQHGCQDANAVLDLLDTDFRWAFVNYQGPQPPEAEQDAILRQAQDACTGEDAALRQAQDAGAGEDAALRQAQDAGAGEDAILRQAQDAGAGEDAALRQTQDTKVRSKAVMSGPGFSPPLAHAATIQDIAAHPWPDPAWWQPGDYAAFAQAYPDHARVLCVGWSPLFWGACEAFGMDEALVKMLREPALFDAYIQRQNEFYLDILGRCVRAAEGHCDICWLGDDYASQQSLLMRPETWRARIKPALAQQVRLAREHGMYVLFHSCGSVRSILPDLIEIGVNALLVFQTTARGMDAPSIARDFGGKMVFYGGMDVQHLLSFATPEEVAAAVQSNRRAFAECGGYIVANSHHTLPSIRGENILAMCRAARQEEMIS